MRTAPGTRVCAVQKADETTVHIFGYGTYEGDHPREIFEGVTLDIPRITLDNGTVVWGNECWWGPAEAVDKVIDGRTVVTVQPRS